MYLHFMSTKIQKWGNSLAVRVPKRVINALNLRLGSAVVIEADEGQAIIRHAPKAAAKDRASKHKWRTFVIPTRRKRQNVSGCIDKILYEAPH